jgi:uncharacterized protein YcfJ
MNIQALMGSASDVLGAIGKWFQRNGKTVAIAGGAAASGFAIAAICKEKNFKKRINQIEKDCAIKFTAEHKKKLEEMRSKYEKNEQELRHHVTEYLRSQGFENVTL